MADAAPTAPSPTVDAPQPASDVPSPAPPPSTYTAPVDPAASAVAGTSTLEPSTGQAAPGATVAADPPAMSKSALKRKRKDELFQAQKQQRRALEKEKKKAKTAEVRRKVAEGLMEKPAPKKKKVSGKQTPHGARIVIDVGFDELMSEKEVKSMASQLAYCYSSNRGTQHPFPLLISSFNGRLRESYGKRVDHMAWKGVEWWEEGFEALYAGRSDEAEDAGEAAPAAEGSAAPAVDPTPEEATAPTAPSESSSTDPLPPAAPSIPPAPLSESSASTPSMTPSTPLITLGALSGHPRSSCPKSSIVYLTGDSPNVLTSLEPGKTYVLGGIVDRNRYKNLCLNKANSLGIAHAQLPIGEYLPEMQTRKVLTVNQVFEILVNQAEDPEGGWREALRKVMPERKFEAEGKKVRRQAKRAAAAGEGGEGEGGEVYVAEEGEGEADEEAADDALIVEKVEKARGEAEREEEKAEHDAALANVDAAALP
ncbi:hypothetical protein JCM10213_007487 [Rhodosporidiobolus nylandii]